MAHLMSHDHAFIDENNKVINVAVFNETDHDSQLLEDIRIAEGATQVICCCIFGAAYVGDTWTGTEFQTISPFNSWVWNKEKHYWESPIPRPDETHNYQWDEDIKNWVETASKTVSLDDL
jgi:hypothetical protein